METAAQSNATTVSEITNERVAMVVTWHNTLRLKMIKMMMIRIALYTLVDCYLRMTCRIRSPSLATMWWGLHTQNSVMHGQSQ